jgi:hypothetical protein
MQLTTPLLVTGKKFMADDKNRAAPAARCRLRDLQSAPA